MAAAIMCKISIENCGTCRHNGNTFVVNVRHCPKKSSKIKVIENSKKTSSDLCHFHKFQRKWKVNPFILQILILFLV